MTRRQRQFLLGYGFAAILLVGWLVAVEVLGTKVGMLLLALSVPFVAYAHFRSPLDRERLRAVVVAGAFTTMTRERPWLKMYFLAYAFLVLALVVATTNGLIVLDDFGPALLLLLLAPLLGPPVVLDAVARYRRLGGVRLLRIVEDDAGGEAFA